MKLPTRSWAGLAMALLALTGCARRPAETFSLSAQVEELSPELQQQIQQILTQQTGSPRRIKLLGEELSADHLQRGADIYARNCQQCHGVTGDGNGIAAKYLYPRPRDYRRGIFKFTSTPYGNKPQRSDLIRTVRQGIIGTSMPAFHLLPPQDLEAVVDYVIALARRGELEILLAAEAEANDEIDPEVVPDLVDAVLAPWTIAADRAVEPVSPMPHFTPESIAAGKQAFLTKGCSKCHGIDGRGRTKENVGQDVWGQTTFAADLTSGMLHGGAEPKDIYRRIFSGINGTPMPAFGDALAAEPDTIWNLVHYVEFVNNQRREGRYPEVDPQFQESASASQDSADVSANATSDSAPAEPVAGGESSDSNPAVAPDTIEPTPATTPATP
jgi:mono/diheme cytochrome c family protein